jgi:lysozyme
MTSPRAQGCDVSHYHPVTDWTALEGAVSFIGAKATQGTGNVDQVFVAHRDGFRASQIPLAIYYHVLDASDPVAQAQHFASVVGPLRANERLCIDVERSMAADASWFTRLDRCASTLLSGACTPGSRLWVYVSAGAWQQIGNPLWDLASEIDLWAPRYGLAEPVLPRGWDRWTAWQNSQTATMPGVDGPCDADVWNGTDADVQAYAGVLAPTRALVG